MQIDKFLYACPDCMPNVVEVDLLRNAVCSAGHHITTYDLPEYVKARYNLAWEFYSLDTDCRGIEDKLRAVETILRRIAEMLP
jgi:hypothetical protein